MNELNQARSELMELYNQTVDNFDSMLEEGVISEDDYITLKNDALDELNVYMSDLEGFNVTDEDNYEDDEDYDDEEENYSMGNDLATFSSGLEPNTRFGAALLELGYSVGYEDPTDLIEDLAEATGNSEQNIYELLMGEAAPDDNFALHASELFGLDEDLALDLVAAGYEARGEDFEDVLNEMEEEYYDSEDNVEEEAVYSRVNELEDELANFKAEQVMKDALNERETKALQLVEEGKMPPIIYEKLFANFNSDNEKIAAFSQVANANGVSLEAELHSIDKVLDVFEEMPELGVFTSYSDSYATEEELNEEKALQDEAQRRLQLRKQRQGGLI